MQVTDGFRTVLNGLLRWIFMRTGLGASINEQLDKPVPRYAGGLMYCLGGLTLVCFVILVVTGAIMAFYYTPSVDHAWDSVQFITYQIPYGFLVRNLHRWSANLMVVFLFMHTMRVFFTGSYKRPRELNWLVGLMLIGVTLFVAFSGYLLPWDNRAYYATVIATNLTVTTTEELIHWIHGLPLVGTQMADLLSRMGIVETAEWVRNFMLGGEEIGPSTLTRFYILHVFLLPTTLMGMMVLHFFLIRKHGVAEAL